MIETRDEGIPSVSATHGFARSLPAKLERLLKAEDSKNGLQLTKKEKKNMGLLKKNLVQIMESLMDPSEVEFPASAAKCWLAEVRELSYDIDDFHDQLVCKCQSLHNNPKLRKPTRRWISSEISRFRNRSNMAIQRYKAYNLQESKNKGQQQISHIICDERPSPAMEDIDAAAGPVGIGDSVAMVEKWLTDDGEPERRVVAVLGLGGVGKTTLANEVYRKLRKEFPCRAFVRASDRPHMRELLTSILVQVRPHKPPDVSESTNLAKTIWTHLQQKKFFIVIDGLCSLSTWDLILEALPDDNCFSRILTTTEVDAVAHRCCGHKCNYMLRMEPLSKNMPQELFFNRFGGKWHEFFESSTEVSSETAYYIKEISSEIVSNCGGFPLAIASMSSLLTRQPQAMIEKWNYIWSSLMSNLRTNPTVEGMKQVLSLCYNSLPDHLKTCMLYLSIYKQGHIIWKDDLVKQWIAEGFICAKEEDMEKVAGAYFDELVTKAMIQPVVNDHNGQVISCTVHYIILQLIQSKSIEENFTIPIHHSDTNIRLGDKVRRLSLQFGDAEDAKPPGKLELSQVRTLAFSGLYSCMPSLAEYQLLRVIILDLWGDDDHIEIKLPVFYKLGYLEIACNVILKLQIQLEGLRYLKTLKIDSRKTEVPEDIVDLPQLWHLSLPGDTNLPKFIGRMLSLRTLGCINLSNSSEDSVQSLEKLMNLHDLRLTSSTMLCYKLKENFRILSSVLSKLNSLKSLSLLPAENSSSTHTLVGKSSRDNIPWDSLCTESEPPALLERLELSPRICMFSKLPSWIEKLGNLTILKIAAKVLLQSDIDILKRLDALSALLLYVVKPPSAKIVFQDGFPVLKHFKFVCSTLCLAFEKGALPDLRSLKLGFNTVLGFHDGRLDQYNVAKAGFENLKRLSGFSAKISDTEHGRQTKSELEDALRSGERRRTINIHLVDTVFDFDEEMNMVGKTDEAQTLGKVEMASGDKDSSTTVEISQVGNSITQPTDPSSSTGDQGSNMVEQQDADHSVSQHLGSRKDNSKGLYASPEREEIVLNEAWNSRDNMTMESPYSTLYPGWTKLMPKNAYSPVDTKHGMKYLISQYIRQERLRAKNDIAIIKLQMELMTTFIVENKETGSGGTPEKWIMQVQDLVHDIEDFVDVYNWLHIRSWRHTLAHMSHAMHLKNRIKIIQEWQRNAIQSKNDARSAAPSGASAESSLDYVAEDAFIGMDGLRNELVQLVCGGRPMLFCIVGPRGVGKTALARSVCNHYDILCNFEKFAWVVASKCSSSGDLVREIFEQVGTESSKRPYPKSYKLNDILQNKRYLVIIDDLQHPGLWHDIQNTLGAAEPRSRIIMTTSIQSVAAIYIPESLVIRMRGLDRSGSKELFMRTFGPQLNPTPARMHALKSILRQCGGLPVAVISIANYLRGQGQINVTDMMEKISNDLAVTPGALEEMGRLFIKEYNCLPDSVHRTCLLSLSTYPTGHLIYKKSLIRSWIANGFVVGDGGRSAQQVADDCFNNLIDRNIIDPVSIGVNAMVKSCRVNGFLLACIVNKSVSKNFVTVIRGDQPYHSGGGASVRRLSVHGGTTETRRVAVEMGLSRVRALTISHGVAFDFRAFKLLRVLDVEGCNQIDDDALTSICSLRLLKYLRLRNTNVWRIPSAIRNLSDLETLDIRKTGEHLRLSSNSTTVVNLPMDVLMLPRLAHLLGRFQLPHELKNKKKRRTVQRFFSEGSRLETLSGFVTAGNNGFDHIVLHIRRLRKVKIWCQHETDMDKDSLHLFVSTLQQRFVGNNALDSLSMDFGSSIMGAFLKSFFSNAQSSGPYKVSSVKLRGSMLAGLPHFVTSPANNLSELQLLHIGLPLDKLLSTLQKLPRLLYLKLAQDGDGFLGDTFVVELDGFPSLERLCFEASKLPRLHIVQGAMPALTSLHLLGPDSESERRHYYKGKIDEQETTSDIQHSKKEWDSAYGAMLELESLENLKEVVLPYSFDNQALGIWKDKARKHNNRPTVTKQPILARRLA